MPTETTVAASVTGWTARRRALAAAGLGGGVALGQAPFALPLVALAALALALVLCLRGRTVRQAAGLGWAFGAGYFAVTLHWIVEPFLVDIARHGWMAPFALVLMAGGLALFWGLAFGLAVWAAKPTPDGAFGRVGLALIVTFTLSEMLRSVIFTGFPWGLLGTIWIDTPLRLLAGWGGPHALGALTVAIALLVAQALVLRSRQQQGLALGAAVLVLGGAFLAGAARDRAIPRKAPADAPIVRVIQPNAPQDQKWLPEMMPVFWARQLDLTRWGSVPVPDVAAGTAQGATESSAPDVVAPSAPDVVVWPEVSLPYLLGSRPWADADIADAAGGAPVLVGAQRIDGPRLLNSLAVIDAEGAITDVYDKHHLVPFGEYIPGGALVRRLGWTGLATDRLGGFDAGPGPAVLDLTAQTPPSGRSLGRVLPLICYEAIFPRHAQVPGQRPDWIVQITNDAWFGNFAGPQQHLDQARMRAVEQGLPLVRAANTGISAVIDPAGRIVSALPLNVEGALDAALPAALPPTLFARVANVPLLIILAALAAGVVVTRRRERSRHHDSHHN
ncbi:apolipoprotein N-acyltransferase [Pseudoruegeria sp. SK021]|nr:apolipoprotein N-acyltransferase [Pseudoruegeria sp. SK021]